VNFTGCGLRANLAGGDGFHFVRRERLRRVGTCEEGGVVGNSRRPARNQVDLMVGSGMQQAHTGRCGANRWSREKRQERNVRQAWQSVARASVLSGRTVRLSMERRSLKELYERSLGVSVAFPTSVVRVGGRAQAAFEPMCL
jgi:hypothetical protein